VLIVQKVQDLDYAAVTDWPEHKRQVESFVLGHLSRMIPGIEDKIVVRTSASAETSWRFTLNHQGAMLGWEMSPDQLGATRPDLASPVRNLFFAGHWVRPGGGITPVIVSAQHAAQAVAGAMSRREWPPRPLPVSVARPQRPPLESSRPSELPASAAPPPDAPDVAWAKDEGLNAARRERAEA
jgi:hypothetical protein